MLNALVLAFALPSFLLTLKALIKSFHAFRYAKKVGAASLAPGSSLPCAALLLHVDTASPWLNVAHCPPSQHLSREATDEDDIVWSRLNFSDKLAFFNLWHITSSIGDLMLVLGSSLTFTRQLGFREDSHERWVVGRKGSGGGSTGTANSAFCPRRR